MTIPEVMRILSEYQLLDSAPDNRLFCTPKMQQNTHESLQSWLSICVCFIMKKVQKDAFFMLRYEDWCPVIGTVVVR